MTKAIKFLTGDRVTGVFWGKTVFGVVDGQPRGNVVNFTDDSGLKCWAFAESLTRVPTPRA